MASNCIEGFKSSRCSNEGHPDIKLLSCFHSLCKTCLEPETTDNRKFITCPFCKTLTPTPPGGIKELPNDFMQKAQEHIDSVKSTVKYICQICEVLEEEKDASHYCIQCKFHLCTRDAKCHLATPTQKGHKVLPHEDLLSSKYDKEIVESQYGCCKVHHSDKHNELFAFCDNCKVMICQLCYVSEHEGHSLTSSRKVSDLFILQIKRRLEEVKANKHEAESKIKKSMHELSNMKMHEQQLIKSVKERGEYLKKIIKELIGERENELKEYQSEECNGTESDLKTLMKEKNNLEHIEDYVENCTLKFSPELLVQHFPTLAKSLKDFLGKCYDIPIRKSKLVVFECKDVSMAEKKIPMIFGQLDFDDANSSSRATHVNKTPGCQDKFSQLYKWQGCDCISVTFNQNNVKVVSQRNCDICGHTEELTMVLNS